MGKFSSDRAINEYAESYWNIEAIPVPDGIVASSKPAKKA
jgi:starch phosphorylase